METPEFPTAVPPRDGEAISGFEEADCEFLELARRHGARELQFPTLISKAYSKGLNTRRHFLIS